MNRWENKPAETSETTHSVSLAGCVVVASPGMQPGLFERSVCIILEHTAERTVGLLLNKRLDADIAPIWEHIFQGDEDEISEPKSLDHINFGGPTSGPIVAIHRERELAEGGNELGVYLAAETDHLKSLAMQDGLDYRLFVGHAVWEPAELEKQIVDGHWHLLPAIPELVFNDESSMWSRAIRTVGNEIVQSLVPTELECAIVDGELN